MTSKFSLFVSLFSSLHPQDCYLSPVRPSSSPCRQSSGSNPHGNNLTLNSGKEKQNAEARFSNSAPLPSPRCSSSSSPSARRPRKNNKERKHTSPRVPVDSGYQHPTVSSTARALSPYTHRKMCQLSEDIRQRLGHLQLGPHHFRKETESQPPFLVSSTNYIFLSK